MSKLWIAKALAILVLVVLAAAALVPTVFAPKEGEQAPEWLASYSKVWDKKINLGLDLQGGLMLQYRVEVEKAVSDKTDRLREDLRTRLERVDSPPKVATEREGLTTIYVTFEDPARVGVIDDAFMTNFPTLTRTDLGGGKVKLEMSEAEFERLQEHVVTEAIGTIRERVDGLGVAEPDIKKAGKSDIVIQLPGLGDEDFDTAKRLIGATAQLEFKLVAEDQINLFFSRYTNAPLPEGLTYSTEGGQPTVIGRDKKQLGAFFAEELKTHDKEGLLQVVFEEIVVYKDKRKEVRDEERSHWRAHLVNRKIELTGDAIDSAQVSLDNRTNKPYVSLNFTAEGGETFYQLTKAHKGKRFAIVLDDVLKSDPVINEPIPGGRAQITLGGYKSANDLYREANELTSVLQHGALLAPIHKQFETSVGPSLGADSVAKGQLALLIASGLVVLFMLVYYKGGGVIANLALALNVLFIMAGLTAVGATLTLPGIAGIVLTIGMAVDANVIIFERVREERRANKSPREAIKAGYDKALSAVLDANITTAIAGVVLMQYGTGPIRGFAVTLLLGIVSSVFTAVVVTRLVYDYLLDKSTSERLSI